MKGNNINTFGKGISFPDFIQIPCIECGEICKAYLKDFRYRDMSFTAQYSPIYDKDPDNRYDTKALCKKCYKTNQLTR